MFHFCGLIRQLSKICRRSFRTAAATMVVPTGQEPSNLFQRQKVLSSVSKEIKSSKMDLKKSPINASNGSLSG